MKTEIVLDVEKNNYKLYHLSMETKEQTNIVYERDFGMHEIPYTWARWYEKLDTFFGKPWPLNIILQLFP